jgi:hypothetical protein
MFPTGCVSLALGQNQIKNATPEPTGTSSLLTLKDFIPDFKDMASFDGTIVGLSKDGVYESSTGVLWKMTRLAASQVISRPDAVYAVTDKLLFKSSNDGRDWTPLRLPTLGSATLISAKGRSFILDADNDRLFSLDLEKSQSSDITPAACDDIDTEASRSLLVVLCIHDEDDPSNSVKTINRSALYVSDNPSDRWKLIPPPNDGSYSSVVVQAGNLYAMVKGTSATRPFSSLMRLEDGQWRKVRSPDFITSVYGSDTSLLALTQVGVYLSQDGETWTKVLQLAPLDIYSVESYGSDWIINKSPHELGTRVLRSMDDGRHWIEIHAPNNEDAVRASIDEGGMVLRTEASSFSCGKQVPIHCKEIRNLLPSGDSTSIAFYHGELISIGHGVFVSDDQTRTFKPIKVVQGKYQMVISPDGVAFLRSLHQAYSSTDGLDWKEIPTQPGRVILGLNGMHGMIFELTEPEQSDAAILAGTKPVAESRKVVAFDKSNGEWREVTGPNSYITAAPIKSLLVDRENSVYVATSTSIERLDIDGIFKNIARGNLSGLRVQRAYLAPDDVLFVGTNGGLLWSNDRGNNWQIVDEVLDKLNSTRSSVTTILPVGVQELLVRNESGLFRFHQTFPAPQPESFSIQLDVDRNIVGHVSSVSIDDLQLPGDSVQIVGNDVLLRTSRDRIQALKDGVHQVKVRLNEAGHEVTVQAYIYKELLKAQFFRPYNKSYALVVSASGKWDTSEVPVLPEAMVQAQRVAELLRGQGFEVETLSDETATLERITSYFQQLSIKITESDRFLFYFSGHGITIPGLIGDRGFLLTYPATKGTLMTRGIPMERIESEYAALRAKHMLFVLDACFSGLAIKQSDLPDKDTLSKFLRYEQMVAFTSKPSRAILTAGTKEQPAMDINGGVFTKAFISGLEGGANYSQNGIITIDQLYAYIQQRVSEESAAHGYVQQPQLSNLSAYGDGKFIFIK